MFSVHNAKHSAPQNTLLQLCHLCVTYHMHSESVFVGCHGAALFLAAIQVLRQLLSSATVEAACGTEPRSAKNFQDWMTVQKIAGHSPAEAEEPEEEEKRCFPQAYR